MTSEYVTLGHPDRTADYISEYILDRYIEKDPDTRYALEVQIKDNFVTLAGEITSKVEFNHDDYTEFVKNALREIGYTEEYSDKWGEGNTADPRKIEVTEHISQQSPQISQGVDNFGWGDQGIFWGMAVNTLDTNLLPYDYWLARSIGEDLFTSGIGGLDIKTQVTVENGEAVRVIVAIPLLEKDKEDGIKKVEKVVRNNVRNDCEVIVNGTGSYVRHSSMGDCGTTGRKLAVDFYGGNCRIGGGSPWTKDPTKADLTLNIYARQKALEYLRFNYLHECHCQIECCIGKKDITIHYYDENMKLLDTKHESKRNIDIINELRLKRPIYTELARKGLFNTAYWL